MEYVSVFRNDYERVEEVAMPNYLSEIENDLDTAYHSTKNEKVANFINRAICSLHAAKRQYSGSNNQDQADFVVEI